MNRTIWIDLDNTPHVPFFLPIIGELRKRGYELRITSRDCSQTCGLADLHHLAYERIGRHYGKNRVLKVAGTLYRALQLAGAVVRKKRPALALSHGSRAQMIAALFLGIPSLVIMDYEHVSGFVRPRWVMMPDVVAAGMNGTAPRRVLRYRGIKEDAYVPFFKPDPRLRRDLQVADDEILITVRPPATEAHYHNAESETLFTAVVERLLADARTRMVILPRYEQQKRKIALDWPHAVSTGRIMMPDRALDGLNLLWHSDLVISGGGTMNREAAALGVPVYSIFRGRIGAVDRWLQEQGRLVLIGSVEDVHAHITVAKRASGTSVGNGARRTLSDIVDHIEHVVG
jgi:predicted glycosyltransferase